MGAILREELPRVPPHQHVDAAVPEFLLKVLGALPYVRRAVLHVVCIAPDEIDKLFLEELCAEALDAPALAADDGVRVQLNAGAHLADVVHPVCISHGDDSLGVRDDGLYAPCQAVVNAPPHVVRAVRL